jgi:hypothetical protein
MAYPKTNKGRRRVQEIEGRRHGRSLTSLRTTAGPTLRALIRYRRRYQSRPQQIQLQHRRALRAEMVAGAYHARLHALHAVRIEPFAKQPPRADRRPPGDRPTMTGGSHRREPNTALLKARRGSAPLKQAGSRELCGTDGRHDHVQGERSRAYHGGTETDDAHHRDVTGGTPLTNSGASNRNNGSAAQNRACSRASLTDASEARGSNQDRERWLVS